MRKGGQWLDVWYLNNAQLAAIAQTMMGKRNELS